MSHTATLTFWYDDHAAASTIERALRPEVGTIEGDRSQTTVERDGTQLVVEITADDPTALRAAKSTWFSLVRSADGAATAGR